VQLDRCALAFDEFAGRTAECSEVCGGAAQDHLVAFDFMVAELDGEVGEGSRVEEAISCQHIDLNSICGRLLPFGIESLRHGY
jgi:hypothetical protein